MKRLLAIVAIAALSAVAEDRVIYATFPGTNISDKTKPIGVVKESNSDTQTADEIREMRKEIRRDAERQREARDDERRHRRMVDDDENLMRDARAAYDYGYRQGLRGEDADGNPLR